MGALAADPGGDAAGALPVAFAAPGGWRVVVLPRPESTTVALRWLVAAGGRHDGARPGLSHFTQHLVFRATHADRPELFSTLDAVGAEAGSQTSREYAEFQAVVAAPQRAALLALVPELVRPPAADLTAAAQQRRAICAAVAAQPPARVLWDLLHEALWADDPLARPPEGTAASVEALGARHVAAHHAARYGPLHTVLAVAGACTVDEVRAAVAPLSLHAAASASLATSPSVPRFAGPGERYRWAPAEVVHVAVAVPTPGMVHPDRSALRLLDYVLGRGGSSRLYHDLRERRGLVYACGSAFMPYADVGLFAAQATCAPARAAEVAARLAEHLLALGAYPPSESELRAAQVRYAGALQRGFETNASLTSLLGVETLLGEREPLAASVARVQAVTPAELAAVARERCAPPRLVRAATGPTDPWSA